MKIKFEPRDVWIGLYWKTEPWTYPHCGANSVKVTCYLCVIPMFPIIWEFEC